MGKKNRYLSVLKHPLTIALVPIVAAFIAFCWFNYFSCPKVKIISTVKLEKVEQMVYFDSIKIGVSKNYNENINSFIYIRDTTTNFDSRNDKREEILANYFKSNNKEFFLNANQQKSHLDKHTPYFGMTYLYGSAGVGKSFIKRPLSKLFESYNCIINLNQALRVGNRYGTSIELSAQLYSSDIVLGELPKIIQPASFNLDVFLTEHGCKDQNNELKKVIIIDDLDEIHPDSSKLILELLDQLLVKERSANPNGFLSLFILGRPEAFSEWLSDAHHSYARNFNDFNINGPGFKYTSDIELMAMNYFMYMKHTNLTKKNIESLNNSFLGKEYLFSSSANNLSNSNYTIKRLIEDSEYTDIEIKDKLFSDYLARNSSSHNRPRKSGKKGEIYKRLLQNIAAKYINNIDKNGYFEVDISDSVNVVNDLKNNIEVLGDISGCEEKLIPFNVQQTLEYSGIVSLLPINDKIKKYRFRPFWAHRYLINKRNYR